MAAQSEFVGMVVGASVAGAFGEAIDDLEYAARKFQIDQATGTGNTDVHVRMEHLVDFYNALADIHEQLDAQQRQVQARAVEFDRMKAGGHVAGVTKAWVQMTSAAGANNARASMAAGLAAVDNEVLGLMNSLHENATRYAANEEYALTSLGRAAGTGGKHHGKSGGKHHGASGGGKAHGTSHGNDHGTSGGSKVQGDQTQQVVGFGGR